MLNLPPARINPARRGRGRPALSATLVNKKAIPADIGIADDGVYSGHSECGDNSKCRNGHRAHCGICYLLI